MCKDGEKKAFDLDFDYEHYNYDDINVGDIYIGNITTVDMKLKSGFVTMFFFFNDTATTEIYTLSVVGSVRCV